jgi:hypothetical protein
MVTENNKVQDLMTVNVMSEIFWEVTWYIR